MIREGSAAAGEPTGTGDGRPGPAALGWPRAVLETVAVLVVGFLLVVYAPHYLLTHLGGVSRSARAALATAWFFVVLAAMAWSLRRLQRHHVI